MSVEILEFIGILCNSRFEKLFEEQISTRVDQPQQPSLDFGEKFRSALPRVINNDGRKEYNQ